MNQEIFTDLIILGGGPAGIAASIYSTRGMLKTILLETTTIGGQLNWTKNIENYPGYPTITGSELINKFNEQLNILNVEIFTFQEILNIDLSNKKKVVTTSEKTFFAKTIIICTGAGPKKLGIKGEDEYTGRGVSYCAVCDGAFFKDKEICVIGGGNSSVEEGLYLTKFARKVNIIHRRDSLRANKLYEQRAIENPKINFIWNTVPDEIQGNEKGVNNIILKNVITGEITNFKTDGIFPYIGTKANTDLFKNQLELDENGYIITNIEMCTNIPGVFAAGDVRKTPLRQIVVSASDGAIAATSAIKYIDELFKEDINLV